MMVSVVAAPVAVAVTAVAQVAEEIALVPIAVALLAIVVVPPAAAAHEVTPEPSVTRTLVAEPLVAGSWKSVPVPAAAAVWTVTEPDVDPKRVRMPPGPVLVPRVRVVVAAKASVAATTVPNSAPMRCLSFIERSYWQVRLLTTVAELCIRSAPVALLVKPAVQLPATVPAGFWTSQPPRASAARMRRSFFMVWCT
jgi:hypothetical protein